MGPDQDLEYAGKTLQLSAMKLFSLTVSDHEIDLALTFNIVNIHELDLSHCQSAYDIHSVHIDSSTVSFTLCMHSGKALLHKYVSLRNIMILAMKVCFPEYHCNTQSCYTIFNGLHSKVGSKIIM